MKNSEILNLWAFLNFPKVSEAIKKIKGTTFQWWLRRNFEKIEKAAKEIYAEIDKLKADEFKKAIAENNQEEIKRLSIIFEQQPEVIELLAIENDLVIKKVNISDLPNDLDGLLLDIVEWMIEKN